MFLHGSITGSSPNGVHLELPEFNIYLIEHSYHVLLNTSVTGGAVRGAVVSTVASHQAGQGVCMLSPCLCRVPSLFLRSYCPKTGA